MGFKKKSFCSSMNSLTEVSLELQNLDSPSLVHEWTRKWHCFPYILLLLPAVTRNMYYLFISVLLWFQAMKTAPVIGMTILAMSVPVVCKLYRRWVHVPLHLIFLLLWWNSSDVFCSCLTWLRLCTMIIHRCFVMALIVKWLMDSFPLWLVLCPQ